MTTELYKLSLDELKELYADDKLSRDDLFIKNNDGNTVLDHLSEEDQEKVLALFDDKKEETLSKEEESESITDEMINKIREHLKVINNILTFNEE